MSKQHWWRATRNPARSAVSWRIRPLVDSNPAMVQYRDAMLRGPLAMGLRYQSIRAAKAMLSDAELVAMTRQTRSTRSAARAYASAADRP